MPDGTVYAGISPSTGRPMYADAADALPRRTWLQKVRGKFPLTLTFNQAQKHVSTLNLSRQVQKQKPLRIPTARELKALFEVRAAIGGFAEGRDDWYWSSTQGKNLVLTIPFSTGISAMNWPDDPCRLRCVRD